MVFNVDSGKLLMSVPHASEYRTWKRMLNQYDAQALSRIQRYLDEQADSKEVLTSSWIPGSDWDGTIFEPLYYACKRDESRAAQFYGLILFDVMTQRPETWGYGRYTTADGKQIKGLTYFRLNT